MLNPMTLILQSSVDASTAIRKTPHIQTLYWIFLLAAILHPAMAVGADRLVLHHDVNVKIDPEQQQIIVIDRIQFPAQSESITLLINANLSVNIHANAPGVTLTPGATDSALGLRQYVLALSDTKTVTLRVSGNWANSKDTANGHVSSQGVYLAPANGWLPIVANSLTTFTLGVQLPETWVGLSQGVMTKTESATTWRELAPQPGVWLIAGQFFRHESKYRGISLEGYFFNPDAELAKAYFDSAATWLARYDKALGAYPYAKLAIVENFWESGYGMPSFALLGSKVLRLPFIPHTAWPHEILHSWFGNGVYPGQDGNWSEGLTAYLADHAVKELAGESAGFRRDALEKYLNYVDASGDIALDTFRFRHSNESAAIGYDKSLMVFHMLRLRIGESAFLTGLRRLVTTSMHDYATWEDIKRHMVDASGQDLDRFFKQWVREAGAPRLELRDVSADGNCAVGTIEQDDSKNYELRVPVFVHFGGSIVEEVINISDTSARFSICADQTPKRVDVDPRFDVFRRIDRGELPASIGELITTKKVVAIIPSAASDSERGAWQRVAAEAGVDTVDDATINTLPNDVGVWIFGADNRFTHDFLDAEGIGSTLGDETVHSDQQAIVIVRRLQDRPVGLASVPPGGDVRALMKRLKHYSRYGYLAFRKGDRVASIRGQWPLAANSPLSVHLVGDPPSLDLTPRAPLMAE